MHETLLWLATVLLARRGSALVTRQQGSNNAIQLLNSTQNVSAPSFIGAPVSANPLGPQTIINPNAALLHQTGGNQGFQQYPGPLGNSVKATGYNTPIYTSWWGLNGDLTVATAVPQGNTSVLGICAIDPHTFERFSCWVTPDPTEQLNFAYSELVLETNDILLNSPFNNLYVVHRNDNDTFSLDRYVNVTDLNVLGMNETVKNALFDTDGNIWFTTGAFTGNIGDAAQNTTTVGYIETDNTAHVIHIDNAVIENGISVSNTTMFIQTGPAGTTDHANATSQMYAFTLAKPKSPNGTSTSTSAVGEPEVLWNTTYAAGSVFKPGGFGRGSGTSNSLLGHDFVAIVDHSDIQTHMNIYSQTSGAQVCQVPIFGANAGAVDNGLLNAWDGQKYGVVALNDYNVAQLFVAGANFSLPEVVNGDWNNMTAQSPGVARVDVTPQADGGAKCSLAWDLPLRVKAVATISTGSGLVYAWIQDEELALRGEWVWYAVAIDFKTGGEVWRVKAGTGGNFNDNFQASSLSPDGRFLQGVQGGVVVVEDEC